MNKQKRFNALIAGLHTDVYRYAYWICGHRQMAEDLTQETFLRAWRALDSLKDEKAAKAWLMTIVRRENARQYERYRPPFVDIDVEVAAGMQQADYDGESYGLRRAIARLEVEYREPLILQIVGGFSGEEIGKIMDLKPNTVATRLFRARNQLKALYKETDTSQQVESQADG